MNLLAEDYAILTCMPADLTKMYITLVSQLRMLAILLCQRATHLCHRAMSCQCQRCQVIWQLALKRYHAADDIGYLATWQARLQDGVAVLAV